MLDSPDNLELALTQYLDGALPPNERPTLESRLANDPQAADLLRQFRELDAALKLPPALPNINWPALAKQISAHIDATTNATTTDEDAFADAPASLPMPWLSKHTRGLAIAASLALASGLALFLLTKSTPATAPTPNNTIVATNTTPHHPTPTLDISGPTPEYAIAPVSAKITIGPSPALAQTPDYYHTQALLTRPSRVVIEASALPTDRPTNDFFR